MVAIALQNLSREFPGKKGPTRAVDSVSLTIPSGQLFFLLGPSGCGKTTLLRMIAGFATPSAGSIRFDDRDISFVPPHQRDTGMVFQSYALWPHMTVEANVGFGLDARRIRNPQRAARIHEALTLVQMQHLADRKPNQLSGGQQQRVALARALAIRPKCLLLDEPLSNLDAKLRLDMRAEIRRIVKQTGITAVYVTHDQKEALSMADAIAVLRAGKLEQTGAPADLYRTPASRFVADFIGECNFLPATVELLSSTNITLKTPVGPLMAAPPRNSPNLKVGAKLLAAFRPESVSFTSPSPLANRFSGRRVSTTYLGEMAEHVIELVPELRIKGYEMNPRPATAQDDTVPLFVQPENVMLITES